MRAPMTEAIKPPLHKTAASASKAAPGSPSLRPRTLAAMRPKAGSPMSPSIVAGPAAEPDCAISLSMRPLAGQAARRSASSRSRRPKPENVVDHLDGLECYLYGGSYFDGIVARRSGPMRWGQ